MTPFSRLFLTFLATFAVGALIGATLMWRFGPQPPAPIVATPAPPKPEPAVQFTPVELSSLPAWSQDSTAQALPALKRSCAKFAHTPPDEIIGAGLIARPAQAWQAACAALGQLIDGDAAVRAVLEQEFAVYRVAAAGDSETPERGTFTGYYESDLNASLVRGGAYQVPIYGPPRDLVTINVKDFLPQSAQLPGGIPANLVGRVETTEGGANRLKPYYTRAQIDAEGAIADAADVLMWADDPVAVHILHIQGSGRALLPDGQMLRVGFAGSNGRAFRGIGSILLEAGELKAGGASMIAVRDWLRAHPTEAAAYMNRNNRYIFFRKLDAAEAEDGPVGALGVSLTPGRSLAVDPRFIPLGAPLWLDTVDPDGLPIQRLMVAQDVGAAITGPVRGDVFWGHGEEAFLKAGRMKSAGGYFIFVPKAAAESAPKPAAE